MPENTNHAGSSGGSGSGGNGRIKTRSTTSDVHVIDKAENLAERTKTAYVRTKQNARNILDDSHDNETNYAQDRAAEGTRQAVDDTKENIKRGGRKLKDEAQKKVEDRLEKKFDTTTEHGRVRTKEQVSKRGIKTRDAARQGTEAVKTTAKSSGKATVKTAEHSVKGTARTIKTAEETAKATVKTTEAATKVTKESAQAAAKASEKAAVAAKEAAVATAKAAVAAAKAIAAALKAAAAGLWKFAAAAGAAIVSCAPFIALGIVLIAVAVLLTGDTAHTSNANDTTSAIAEINEEWKNQIDEITNGLEDKTMEGGRATWPQVFSVYTAKSDDTSVSSWDEVIGLKQIFFDMNWVSYDIYAVVEAEKAPEADIKILMRSVDSIFLCSGAGQVIRMDTEIYQNEQKPEELAEKYPKRKIHSAITVTVRHRSVEEMAAKYGFSQYQLEHAQALLEDQFASFWQERLYGVAGADDDIVNVAVTQLGNSGGWPYWEYAGFPSRVEWCACFVSWCAGQCGYIDKGLFINTGYPPGQVDFFRNEDHWMDGSGTPSPGMIIFFDWYNADFADHVGIVEYVEDGYVHTIEGNSGDAVQRGTWAVGDSRIQGYGWILEK